MKKAEPAPEAATMSKKPAAAPAPPPPAAKKAESKAAEPAPVAAPRPAAKPVSKPVAKTPSATPAPQPAADGAFAGAAETFERSFKEASQGTIAVNRKLIDFARTNINSSLEHVRDLAEARSPVRIMRLQMEYWQDCLETFASQAQELRVLTAELVTRASEPVRQHMRNGPRRTAS